MVASGLEVPWGLVFLPDGNALVSERDSARLLTVTAGGNLREIGRLDGVDAIGEGGLLGLTLSPNFGRDRLLYAYYTSADDNRVVRLRLDPTGRAGAPQPVLTGIPRGRIHNGGRMAFGPDGLLYVATGEAGQRNLAQDRGSLGGKILRLRPDGSVPPDNPFPGSPVYSLGHRNVQGLAWDPAGRLYASEFGQNQYDEVNRIQPGRNYGWPQVEGRGETAGHVDPLVTWSTDEASPSGMAYAAGSLWLGGLRGERLWQVRLDGRGGVAGEPRDWLRGQFGRLRSVVVAPSGELWVTTSNRDGRGDPTGTDDRILRVPLRP